MHLKRLELNGFKSFAHKSEFIFDVPIIAIVGPNGSGKSNVVEAIRFVLGEQSVKSMRGKTGSDLIFKGSRDVKKKSRASVSITFDNKDRVFSIEQSDRSNISVDFDEVLISREVFSDGSSSYAINGTQVRMKDIHELIASINIGSSGHHIISQGEADRYLNANAKDRRSLIEEALGLRVYQYRIKESLRKLERSQENLRETELLRREIAPHLRFLKRQVDKIEQAKEIRSVLVGTYSEYLRKEDLLIRQKQDLLQVKETDHKKQETLIQEALSKYHIDDTDSSSAEEQELKTYQSQRSEHSTKRQERIRELGRIEGMISVLQKPKKVSKKESISLASLESFIKEVHEKIQSLDKHSYDSVSAFLDDLTTRLSTLVASNHDADEDEDRRSDTLNDLVDKRDRLNKEVAELDEKLSSLTKAIHELEEKINHAQQDQRERQKKYYEFLAQKRELHAQAELLSERRASLEHQKFDQDNHKKEAIALLGEDQLSLDYQEDIDEETITAQTQAQLLREIERSKIRLEDMGGGSGVEVIKEYKETQERDDFLKQEMEDVDSSIASLQEIISGLKDTLNQEFASGIEKINSEFNRFFGLMFGGGDAQLKEVPIHQRKSSDDQDEQEPSDKEYGIDIVVQLPRKKVSDLDMLSGGERSLTSIALLFALSQVNPPPFLVLDETDAALDEANSQKYGDMIESLSEYSQLILVTHNRETMSRAQTLFGVTLGRDDASTMLSLRLEDAEQYAK